jgi:hypothetical protein
MSQLVLYYLPSYKTIHEIFNQSYSLRHNQYEMIALNCGHFTTRDMPNHCFIQRPILNKNNTGEFTCINDETFCKYICGTCNAELTPTLLYDSNKSHVDIIISFNKYLILDSELNIVKFGDEISKLNKIYIADLEKINKINLDIQNMKLN